MTIKVFQPETYASSQEIEVFIGENYHKRLPLKETAITTTDEVPCKVMVRCGFYQALTYTSVDSDFIVRWELSPPKMILEKKKS